MKRNDNYIVRKIAGETLLVPTGAAAREFSGLITLNELGAFIWEHLNEAENVQDLAKMIATHWLTAEFEGGRHQRRVDEITAIENGEEL